MNAVIYVLYFLFFEWFMMLIMIELRRIIFLEKHTKEQRKLTLTMIFLSGIFSGIKATIRNVYDNTTLEWILYIILIIMMAGIFSYSAVTGRKRSKWLGLFTFFPMYGIFSALTSIIDLPMDMLSQSDVFSYMVVDLVVFSIITIAYTILLVKKPSFVQNLENAMEKRTLNAREEAVVWVVGIWLFIFATFGSSHFEGFAYVYCTITNVIVTIVIYLLVFDSNYRKFYHEKNMNLQL